MGGDYPSVKIYIMMKSYDFNCGKYQIKYK